MMYRKRIGVWMIFVVACLVLQMIVPLIPSMAINFKQALLDQEFKSIIQELQKVDEEVAENNTTINDSDETDDSEVSDQEEAEAAINMMLNIILTTGKYVGILIVIFGIFSMVMGFRDENAEAMSNAVRLIVVGAVLVGAGTIVQSLFEAPAIG